MSTVSAIAVLGEHAGVAGSAGTLDLGEGPIRFGRAEVPEPVLDSDREEHRHRVCVRVSAASVNFRDRARAETASRHIGAGQSYVIGSEFAGVVEAVGPAVTRWAPGDRVMADHHWTGAMLAREGVPTNHASRGLLLIEEHRLHRIPETMLAEEAACFSLNAQTAMGMARHADVGDGSRVLLLSGRSNVALFALEAVRALGAESIDVVTTTGAADRLLERGATRVHVLTRKEALALSEVDSLRDVASSMHGFDAVLDPFVDLHLGGAIGLVRAGGDYVYCGWRDQREDTPPPPGATGGYGRALQVAMLRGIRITGSCLGTSADLGRAVEAWEEGRLSTPVHGAFEGSDVLPFLRASWLDPQRMGKVAWRHG